MLTIREYSVEYVKDPFGIIPGKRYEFILDIEVPEEDELYHENGLYIRVIYGVGDSESSIVKYDIIEKLTERIVDFDLEDDEAEMVEAFCKERYTEAE